MDKKEIVDIIKKEIEKITNSSLKNIGESCSLMSTGHENIGLCSLELVQLLVELENIFYIEFKDKMDTVLELVEYIENNMVNENERTK